MYHPSRGGVRGGRDQFNWDDVKNDKHRENYLGHSIKAPVGRWQKGKDLHWYAKGGSQKEADAARAEIARVKEEEEQLMREALGLAPKRDTKPRGSNIDKHEAAELFKRGVKDDSAPDYAPGQRVEGLGFAPAPKPTVVQQDAGEDSARRRNNDKEKSETARQPQGRGREVSAPSRVEAVGREKEEADPSQVQAARSEADDSRKSRAIRNGRDEHGIRSTSSNAEAERDADVQPTRKHGKIASERDHRNGTDSEPRKRTEHRGLKRSHRRTSDSDSEPDQSGGRVMSRHRKESQETDRRRHVDKRVAKEGHRRTGGRASDSE